MNQLASRYTKHGHRIPGRVNGRARPMQWLTPINSTSAHVHDDTYCLTWLLKWTMVAKRKTKCSYR